MSDQLMPPDSPISKHRAVAAAVVLIIVFNGAFGAHDLLPPLVPFQDKLEHLAAFGALGVLACWRTRHIEARLLLLMAFAAFIELGQMFTPTRTPDVIDFLFSCAGAVIGALAALTLERPLRSARSSGLR